MTPEILAWLADTVAKFSLNAGDVLEVGSYDVNGSPRSLFEGAKSYTGIDMRAGAGVDLIVHSSDMVRVFGRDAFDVVVCCETLEHDSRFWETVTLMRETLRRGGALIITTPTVGFPYHAYPRDYYRFTTDTYSELFFAGMQLLRLTTLNSAAGAGTTIAGVARK